MSVQAPEDSTFFKDCSKNFKAPMRSPALYFSCPLAMHSAACACPNAYIRQAE